jgi:hypothetical protein
MFVAAIYDFVKAHKQKTRWGMSSGELYRCSLYQLILQFVKSTKAYRLDPFDDELALWVEDLSKAVLVRCSNKDLKEEAQTFLDKGVWATYKTRKDH